MSYAALTGISPAIIAELKHGKPRTVELHLGQQCHHPDRCEAGRSCLHNRPRHGGPVPGDPGILVEVISLAITMKRSIEFTNPMYFEERERMAARMQVRYSGTSLVKQVETRKMASPITIEPVKTGCYHAR